MTRPARSNAAKRGVCFVLGMALALLAGSAQSMMGPTFNARFSIVQATHIVVATEGRRIDGKLKILESWKGDLLPGESIEIPELSQFTPTKARQVSRLLGDDSGMVMSGKRMILFLVKSQRAVPGDPKTTFAKWLPASYPDVRADIWPSRDYTERMRISVAWNEDDVLYAFTHIFTTEPLELFPVGEEKTIKQDVEKHLKRQQDLAALNAIADPAKRVTQAVGHARSYADHVYDVIEIVSGSGEPARSGLRRMLDDPAFAEPRAKIVRCLADVAGSDAGPDLTRVLEKELLFWRETAPSLAPDWWNGRGVSKEEKQRLHWRYRVTLETLRALEGLGAEACEAVVSELRDFWRSLPQLEDDSGLAQLSATCDGILDSPLRPPAPRVKHAWGFGRAASKPDPVKRAQALVPFIRVGNRHARDRAFNALAECGVPALSHFRAILEDETQRPLHCRVVRYMARAGGLPVGGELAKLVSSELAFWKQDTTLQTVYDQNALSDDIRTRCAMLAVAIEALDWLEYPDGTDEVIPVLRHWRDLPGPWSLDSNPIIEHCVEYLSNTRKRARAAQ